MSNQSDALQVTLEQLALMHRALSELNSEKQRYSPDWFAVVAEGPLEEIRRLEAEVDRLTGRAELGTASGEVVMRVVGAGVEWPGSPLSILTSFGDALRKGIQTISELVLTGDLSSRPTRALNEACDLRLMSLSTGSLVMIVELPTATQGALWTPDEERAANQGMDLLLAGATWAAGSEDAAALATKIPKEEIRRAVLAQVKRLVPRPRGRVTGVELSGLRLRGGSVLLSREATGRVDAAIDAIASTQIETHEGDLREIDLDRRTLVLRGVGDGDLEVSCEYLPDLDETALDALDKRVSVTGTRPVDAGRKRAALKIHRLTVVDRGDSD